MNILINPVISLVQRSVDKLIDECYFCCRFNQIVEDFEKEKGNLIATQKTVQKDVEAAKSASQEIEEEVKKWLSDAKCLIGEDTRTKQKRIFNLCHNCVWRYRRGKDLAQKKVDVTELIKKSNFTKVGRPIQSPGIKFHLSPDYIDFESRKSAKKQLLDALAERSSYLIGLQGMGGCGKSHLVKQVGNEVQSSEPRLFDKVIYVFVSSSPNVKKIQHEIARHLGLTLEEGKESEHPEKLWGRLTNGEKILIILDDVWADLKLNDIGILLGQGHKGCCVLITTRNKRVCMDCQILIELETLSGEDAWILFIKRATQGDDDLSIDFKNVGQKIMGECQGLPITISAIANTLKGRSIEHWNAALTSLKSAQPIENTEEGLIIAYKSLQLSYEHLKSEEAKKLFLLCFLFREDYEIPIEDISRFSIGLGLFGEDGHFYEILRGKVISALAELIDSSLLLQANQRCVSMHDLIGNAFLRSASEVHSIMGPRIINMLNHGKIRYLYCRKMDDFPYWLSTCTNLEFLIVSFNVSFRDYVGIPEAFFERMKGLKVLQLALQCPLYDWESQETLTPRLPQSIKLPQNLRALHVRGWYLGDITLLEKLEKLEMLDLSHCFVNELPNGIANLKKLRFLALINCSLKKNPWEVISRLSKIEEIYFMGNELYWESEEGNNFFAGLFDENNVVQALQRYHIDIRRSCRSRRNLCVSGDDSTSRVLLVDYFGGFAADAKILDLVRRAEILELNKIWGGYRNVTPDVVEAIGDMNELIQLGLDSCSDIECLIDTTSSTVSSLGAIVFKRLVKLVLENMDQLIELCHGTPAPDTFRDLQELHISRCNKLDGRIFAKNLNLTRLEVLKVRDCSSLKSLFTLSTARSLVQLKRLEIYCCDQLKHIVTNENEEENGDEVVDIDYQQQIYSSFLPKLLNLNIDGGGQLEFIFPFSSVPTLSSVESIHLRRSSLKYMFGPYPNKNQLLLQMDNEIMLPACNKIELIDLPNFISFLPESCHPPLYSSYQEDGPEARQSEITTASGSENSNLEWPGQLKQWLAFRNIRMMVILNCPKLISLFTLPIETMLLEELIIVKCDALRHIIENGGGYLDQSKHGSMFPKLKRIDVLYCELLEYIFPAALSGNLASLETIMISNAPKLRYVFGADISFQKQNLEMKICIPKLESIYLENLESFFSICVANCYATWPSLKSFHLWECPHLTIACIKDFLVGFDTTQVNWTTEKGALRETRRLLSSCECLSVWSTKTEGIFNVERVAVDGQVNSKLRELMLYNIHELKYIFMGPEDIFNLSNVEVLVIKGCQKLKVILSASVLKSLPQLHSLYVEDCQDLEQIVEMNEENQKESKRHNQQVCFSSLALVVVKRCGNLRHVFSISTYNAFPNYNYCV